jgi:hypothetical protein
MSEPNRAVKTPAQNRTREQADPETLQDPTCSRCVDLRSLRVRW